jgi:hypothetical protein
VPRGQHDGSLRPYSRFSKPEPLLFLQSSSSVVLTRLSGPRYETFPHEIKHASGYLKKRQQFITISSVSTAMDYKLAGWCFDSLQRQEAFHTSTASVPTAVPNWSHIQWVPGTGGFPAGEKQPQREGDHSSPSRA